MNKGGEKAKVEALTGGKLNLRLTVLLSHSMQFTKTENM